MNDNGDVQRMWVEWKALPFPSAYGGKDVAGICVTSLDTFAAGCIDTFVSRKGQLDEQRIKILEKCKTDLELIVIALDGDARTYSITCCFFPGASYNHLVANHIDVA